MTEKKKTNDKNLTFEEAVERLEVLLKEMEEGRQPLAQALDMFSEGMELARICNQHLQDGEQRLAILTADENDQPVLQEAGHLPADTPRKPF